MKELEFIDIIKNNSKSTLIGDDCAYLKDLNIVVSQDNFVEDVHFKREWASPYQIGYKATVVNISDILASGGKPEYITVGLSLPKDIDEAFVKEFYRGVNDGLLGAKLAGGDITASEKIFVSITAIGSTKDKKVSSRKNAKVGYTVITTGNFGSSSKGLYNLQNNINTGDDVVKAHLEPKLNYKFSQNISTNIEEDYAMMDTSDGLADALFKIAEASNVTLKIDYSKIPHLRQVTDKNDILFGGEDYNLVAVVPNKILKYLENYTVIGEVLDKIEDIKFIVDGIKYKNYNQLKLYDHFIN